MPLHRRLALALALMLAAPLAGCADKASDERPTSPFPIVLTRTGGVANVKQEITVVDTGEWTYTDKTEPSPLHGKLGDPDRIRMIIQLTDPRLGSQIEDAEPDGACADAFTYQLTVSGTTRTFEDCRGFGAELTTFLGVFEALTPM